MNAEAMPARPAGAAAPPAGPGRPGRRRGRGLGIGYRLGVQRPEWLRAFAVAVAALGAVFLAGALVSGVDPGNGWGLGYGIGAALLMLAAAALGVRRRTMARGWGRSQDWVQLHVYGGTLAMLLVLMHSGFSAPGADLGWWLLVLSLWVTLSGLAGMALRRWVPRLLTSALDTEALYERIPELVAELAARAEAVVAGASPPVRDLHRRRLAPVMARPEPRWIYLFDLAGAIAGRLGEVEFLRRRLGGDERERLDELAALYRAKLQLDAHLTLQRPLRWWLYAHVPVSLVLLALVAIHVAVVVAY